MNCLELCKQLIACPSVTPNDAGCQQIIASRLEKIGFNITNLKFGEVDNLWATYGNSGPHLMFAGHTDVVPPGDLNLWKFPPFELTEHKGDLYGRGAADMKGCIAAMVCAVEEYIKKYPNFNGTISFLLTSDEEGPAKDGTVKVVEQLKKDNIKVNWCLVGEPISQNRVGDIIKMGSRGSLTGLVTFTGKQGHVGYPQQANNPIHATLSCINKLPKITGLQITNLNSGVGAENVIPEQLTCQFNIRYADGISVSELQSSVNNILQQQELKYDLKWSHNGIAYESMPGVLTAACQQAIKEVTNVEPELNVMGGTSDGRFIINLDCEVIELGLLNKTIHAVNEHISCEDLINLKNIYFKMLTYTF